MLCLLDKAIPDVENSKVEWVNRCSPPFYLRSGGDPVSRALNFLFFWAFDFGALDNGQSLTGK